MTEKTIRKILRHRHNAFLKSIERDDIKKLINEHAFVTGGAIASLLLEGKVKDLDYYFDDEEACLQVAQYYIDRFRQDNPNSKIEPSLTREPGRVRIIIRSAGVSAGDDTEYRYFEGLPNEMGERYVGGIEEILEESDEIPAKAVDEEPKKKKPHSPVFISSNAITLTSGIQIVVRFVGTPGVIHENYDYAHCTCYWIPKTGELCLPAAALTSLMTMELKYIGSKYPLCSVVRMRKFLKRGFHINAGQILKICFQISELDLTDPNVLEEQLIGVDHAYFRQLIHLLKEKMKEDGTDKVSGIYISSLVDLVFG